jgi:type IV secretion system protein VirD4
LFGLTNVLVMFGGSKDGVFNQEISDLVGQVRVARRTWQTGAMAGRTFSGEDIPVLRPEEIRQLQEREALVLAENGKPIIARLARCIEGQAGRQLLAAHDQLRAVLAQRSPQVPTPEARAAAALAEARHRGIAAEPEVHL